MAVRRLLTRCRPLILGLSALAAAPLAVLAAQPARLDPIVFSFLVPNTSSTMTSTMSKCRGANRSTVSLASCSRCLDDTPAHAAWRNPLRFAPHRHRCGTIRDSGDTFRPAMPAWCGLAHLRVGMPALRRAADTPSRRAARSSRRMPRYRRSLGRSGGRDGASRTCVRAAAANPNRSARPEDPEREPGDYNYL